LDPQPKDKTLTPAMEKTSSGFHSGLLRGLFDSDGSVQGTQAKGISVRLSQNDLGMLEAVQRMLLRLGIAATIYRDREGRVVFQADQLSKVTVISKGFVLPQLPVRETRRAPVPTPASSDQRKPVPIGCDPLASPISQPQLARLTGRCLV